MEREQKHILVVEDHTVNRIVIEAQLARLGHSADIVANGIEAISAVKRSAYELIFMDCQMPEMDGFEATRRIRSYEAERGLGERVPIVALTANAMQGDRDLCIAAGMDDYVTKPATLEMIEEALKRWLPNAAN